MIQSTPAGSYYVENLHRNPVSKANILIEEIMDMGGMTTAVQQGFPKEEIEKVATKKQLLLILADCNCRCKSI